MSDPFFEAALRVPQDKDFRDYYVNLTGCEFWKAGDTVTSLRFDPVNTVGAGKVYIDSIEFLAELPAGVNVQ